MQKLLKLLFTLSTVATLPLSVMACSQQSLDDTLAIIRDGDTKYNITDLLSDQPMTETITEKVLTIEKSNDLAKAIATKILTDNNSGPITWYSDSIAAGTTCYNFTITNGTTEGSNIKWAVDTLDERFTLNISYLVGNVKEDQTFEANQRIQMVYKIKAGTSDSDKIVNDWVTNFNTTVVPTTVDVNLTSKEITIPTTGGWSDLEPNVISATYEAIATKLTWSGAGKVSTWVIESNGTSIGANQLQLVIEAKLNDAKVKTAVFTIKFV